MEVVVSTLYASLLTDCIPLLHRRQAKRRLAKPPGEQYLANIMPSGRVHLGVEMVGLAVLSAVGAVLAWRGGLDREVVAAFLAAFLFSSLLLSPDLDLARSDASRRWGIARVLWLPYARLFRHRRTSHRPVLGPVSRIAYLALLVAAAGALAQWVRGGRLGFAWPGWRLAGSVVLGLYLPNLLHVALDRLAPSGRGR
jgi:uncharacterized metal-binding protein